MKTIDTLVEDIYAVLQGGAGFTAQNEGEVAGDIEGLLYTRLRHKEKPRNYLSMSSVGSQCDKQLWYRVNSQPDEDTPSPDKLKFLYGDMIEALVLELAVAAGHTISHRQTKVTVEGVGGHMDAVIDGMVVDVKSASEFSFKKFKSGLTKDNDSFGYMQQLSGYLYGCQILDAVTEKNRAAFLVIHKVTGEILLSIVDFTEYLKHVPNDVYRAKTVVAGPMPKKRLATVPQNKDGSNTKLCTTCSYCSYKKQCWPEARAFEYYNGVQYLVEVSKTPRTSEIGKETYTEITPDHSFF